jgi:hypothetical protein
VGNFLSVALLLPGARERAPCGAPNGARCSELTQDNFGQRAFILFNRFSDGR